MQAHVRSGSLAGSILRHSAAISALPSKADIHLASAASASRVMRQSVAVCSLAQRAPGSDLWPFPFSTPRPSLFRSGRGFRDTFSHHSSTSCCLVPVYLLRSRLPSLSPEMPSHSPCSVYCQSHHCGNVTLAGLGYLMCIAPARVDTATVQNRALSPSCSFSTWPE